MSSTDEKIKSLHGKTYKERDISSRPKKLNLKVDRRSSDASQKSPTRLDIAPSPSPTKSPQSWIDKISQSLFSPKNDTTTTTSVTLVVPLPESPKHLRSLELNESKSPTSWATKTLKQKNPKKKQSIEENVEVVYKDIIKDLVGDYELDEIDDSEIDSTISKTSNTNDTRRFDPGSPSPNSTVDMSKAIPILQSFFSRAPVYSNEEIPTNVDGEVMDRKSFYEKEIERHKQLKLEKEKLWRKQEVEMSIKKKREIDQKKEIMVKQYKCFINTLHRKQVKEFEKVKEQWDCDLEEDMKFLKQAYLKCLNKEPKRPNTVGGLIVPEAQSIIKREQLKVECNGNRAYTSLRTKRLDFDPLKDVNIHSLDREDEIGCDQIDSVLESSFLHLFFNPEKCRSEPSIMR